MKLELKHITPYLPYGLEVLRQDGRTKFNVAGVENDLLIVSEKDGNKYCNLKGVKPILRPLSSMTKEEFAELRSKLDDGVLLKLTPNGDIYIKCNDEIYLYEVNILNDFLFSNHFDVFGLIDSGLAINRNNLK